MTILEKAFEAGRVYAAYESDLEELLNDWAGSAFDTATITTSEEAWLVLRRIESVVRGSYMVRTKLARIMIDEALAAKRLELLNGVTDD